MNLDPFQDLRKPSELLHSIEAFTSGATSAKIVAFYFRQVMPATVATLLTIMSFASSATLEGFSC